MVVRSGSKGLPRVGSAGNTRQDETGKKTVGKKGLSAVDKLISAGWKGMDTSDIRREVARLRGGLDNF